MPELGDLTERQHVAISLLVAGKTQVQVAEHLKLERRVIANWKREPNFVAQLAAALQEVRESINGKVMELGTKAVKALAKILDDRETTDAIRLKAIEIVLARVGIDGAPVDQVQPDLTKRAERERATPEQLVAIQQRLRAEREAARRSGSTTTTQ